MLHSTALLVLLALLATARLTRLVNADVILDRPRAWLVRHTPETVEYFVTCPWCVSIWVGAGVAGSVYAWHRFWPVQVALVALAGSLTAGLLANVSAALEKAAE